MTKSPKPQPYYARFNQPPRNPSNGRNRQADPTNHSDPLDGADSSAGRTAPRDRSNGAVWTWVKPGVTIRPGAVYPLPPASPSLSLADFAKVMADMQNQMINDMVAYGNVVINTYEPPAPTSIPHSGIISGEITGYRGWVVVEDNGALSLCSLAHEFLWEPGATITGDINKQANTSPFHIIFGGVYAFREHNGLTYEIEDAKTVNWPGRLYHSSRQCYGFAYGTVKLWGEVVEHDRGYRASFAKLTSIDGVISDNVDLPALRSRYHV